MVWGYGAACSAPGLERSAGSRVDASCFTRQTLARMIRQTLHPAPYTLHPTPHNPHPTPCTLHPAPCTLHPTPYPLPTSPYTWSQCFERPEVADFGFRISGFGFRVSGFGFRVSGFEFRVNLLLDLRQANHPPTPRVPLLICPPSPQPPLPSPPPPLGGKARSRRIETCFWVQGLGFRVWG